MDWRLNDALHRFGDKRFSLMKRWFYSIIGFDRAPQIQEGNKKCGLSSF